jgi:tetratricopeptide (TPR) repeat protein
MLVQAIIVGNGVAAPDLIASFEVGQQDEILKNLGRTWKIWVACDLLPVKVRIFKEMGLSLYRSKIKACQDQRVQIISDLMKREPHQLTRKLRTAAFKGLKLTSHKEGVARFKMAMYYFGLPNQELEALSYLVRGLLQLKEYCHHKDIDLEVDRRLWLDIGLFCLERIRLHCHGISKLSSSGVSVIIQEGLKALQKVIEMREDYDAVYYKYLLLQLLHDEQKSLPEDYLACMKHMLDIHPDSGSPKWLEYAQVYGQELAKQKRYPEAIQWFEFLKIQRPHPVNDLYVGKIDDEMGDILTSISHFESAQTLCPDGDPLLKLEVDLWLLSAKIKKQLNTLQIAKEPPQESEVGAVVDLFNRFCLALSGALIDYPNEETSTYVPFGELARSFCLATYPSMANLLLKLKQFQFAIELYDIMIRNFALFSRHKALPPSARTHIFTAKATAHFFLDEKEPAEEAFKEALRLDPDNFEAYQNLIGLYARSKRFTELEELWKEVQRAIEKSGECKSERIGDVLFNLGAAFSHIEDQVPRAQFFFHESLKYDSDNWDTKLHLARTLAVTKNDKEAKNLLIGYLGLSNAERGPFQASSQMNCRIYFVLAGISAICGDIDKAKKAAIEAGKTKFCPEETGNLQRYLRALEQKTGDARCVIEEIRASILKMAFTYRVGSVINSQSIRMSAGTFVGYHGTSYKFVEEFANGIAPKRSKIRQYEGRGFYVTDNRDMASYFAMKKTEEVGTRAILIKVYAKQGLVGEKTSTFKEKRASAGYDFIQSNIDGLEAFSQSYVFETSLHKLRPELGAGVEPVGWTPKEYKDFADTWFRDT